MKRKFDSKLRKVGNSYVVTIPKEIVERFELGQEDFLALEFDSDQVKRRRKNES